MEQTNFPDLSVILITPDSYETIRRTIQSLKRQKVKSKMEIVVVARSASDLNADTSELEEFGRYQIVEVGQIDSIGSAYSAGIRKANAEVVALAEDHSFPQSGWAEELIETHKKECAAVGPSISNANPNSWASWADLFMAYAPWVEISALKSMEHLPGHNSSYKRSILLSYGSDLEKMMEAESVLHWDLRARGHNLFLQPAARTFHTNFAKLSTLAYAHIHAGRQFGASRAENLKWGFPKRIFYAAAAPLIPSLRLWRILQDLQRLKKRPAFLIGLLPALSFGLIINAFGEFLGYLFGAGNSTQKLIALEFHRNESQTKKR